MLYKCYKWLFVFLLLSFVSACNQVEQKSDDEILTAQLEYRNLQINKVLGYWIPLTTDNYAFEFFPSIVRGTEANEIMTGRLYQNNDIVNYFSWDIDSNGQININLIDVNCVLRPVSICNTTDSMMITADNQHWEINHDKDNDGEIDVVFGDIYEKKQLDLSTKKQGEFYLIPTNEYFDADTVLGHNFLGNIELEFSGGEVSSLISDSPVSEIYFNEVKTATSNQTFDILDVGFHEFVIETSFENIALRASVNDSFSYSFEIHRKVIIPEGIDENTVNFDGFVSLSKRTYLVRYVDTFIAAPEINLGDRFFSRIDNEIYGSGWADSSKNDIVFNSSTTGVLTAADVIMNRETRQLNFDWELSLDGAINLNTSSGTLITIKFIREILGGYSVLIITEEQNKVDKSYLAHNFIKDNSFQIVDDMFPGRYQIESNNGYSNILINFTADGIVSFDNFPSLGGYWFINDEGNLISFECSDLLDNALDNYEDCLDSFDFVGTPSRYTQFSHIRQLKFLHRNEDDFLIKYNASFWGGPFGAVGPDYLILNWTYRMKRIGNVIEE